MKKFLAGAKEQTTLDNVSGQLAVSLADRDSVGQTLSKDTKQFRFQVAFCEFFFKKTQ